MSNWIKYVFKINLSNLKETSFKKITQRGISLQTSTVRRCIRIEEHSNIMLKMTVVQVAPFQIRKPIGDAEIFWIHKAASRERVSTSYPFICKRDAQFQISLSTTKYHPHMSISVTCFHSNNIYNCWLKGNKISNTEFILKMYVVFITTHSNDFIPCMYVSCFTNLST